MTHEIIVLKSVVKYVTLKYLMICLVILLAGKD